MGIEDVPLSDLSKLLALCIECAERAIPTLRYDAGQFRDMYIVGMLRAVVDATRGVLVLVQAGEFAGVPILARSALDAHVDVANLCQHEDYWKKLEALDTAEWTRIIERACEGSNQYLSELAKEATFTEGRKLYAQRRRILKAQNVARPTPDARFALAGMTTEYEAVWSILSAQVHNNVSHVRTKYFAVLDDGSIREKNRTESNGQRWEYSCLLHMSELVLQ